MVYHLRSSWDFICSVVHGVYRWRWTCLLSLMYGINWSASNGLRITRTLCSSFFPERIHWTGCKYSSTLPWNNLPLMIVVQKSVVVRIYGLQMSGSLVAAELLARVVKMGQKASLWGCKWLVFTNSTTSGWRECDAGFAQGGLTISHSHSISQDTSHSCSSSKHASGSDKAPRLLQHWWITASSSTELVMFGWWHGAYRSVSDLISGYSQEVTNWSAVSLLQRNWDNASCWDLWVMPCCAQWGAHH